MTILPPDYEYILRVRVDKRNRSTIFEFKQGMYRACCRIGWGQLENSRFPDDVLRFHFASAERSLLKSLAEQEVIMCRE